MFFEFNVHVTTLPAVVGPAHRAAADGLLVRKKPLNNANTTTP
jgi:hypothetical protein